MTNVFRIEDDNVSHGPGFVLTGSTSLGTAAEGDSGGPVYYKTSSGDVTGTGFVSAGDDFGHPAPCDGITENGARQCSWLIFAINLNSALSQIHASLVVAPPACTSADTLQPDQSLSAGQCLASSKREYTLVMQGMATWSCMGPAPAGRERSGPAARRATPAPTRSCRATGIW